MPAMSALRACSPMARHVKSAVSPRPRAQVRVPAVKAESDVETLLAGLEHPLKTEIEKVRRIILNVDSAVSEAVKWNTVSFRTTDFFAAVNLRSKDSLQLIFHTGAKVKATAKTGIDIADPAGLCKWLAKDRCLVTLGTSSELTKLRPALEALVRDWIEWV
jgi:Domain of unknown function (DU1801)